MYPGTDGDDGRAESTEEAYAAIARAQAAVFELGAGRAYTVIKMDERRMWRAVPRRNMLDSVRDRNVRSRRAPHSLRCPCATDTGTAPTRAYATLGPRGLLTGHSGYYCCWFGPETLRGGGR
jgi:hypothetical protein